MILWQELNRGNMRVYRRRNMVRELSDTDEQILNMLEQGSCTKGYISDEIDSAKYKTNSNCLTSLESKGHISLVHKNTALYEMGKDPREVD